MDLSKLTNAQLEVAKKVAAEAERQGLNPDFVLPMVMAESGFDPNAKSPKGAFGVMQLMPDTAKDLNVNPQNIDENIAGGMRLLKQLVNNKNIGNDPNKVLMGYNAGPNTKFFQTGDIKDLPQETLSHIVKVSGHYGGELPSVSSGQPARQEAPAREEATTEQQVAATDEGARIEPTATSERPGGSEVIKPALGVVGGITGAGVAGSLETTKKLLPLVPNILNAAIPGREINPVQPQSRVGLQRYLNSQIPQNIQLSLSELERVSGAGRIRTQSEVQSALRAIQAVDAERVARTTSVDPRTGQPRRIYRNVPGREAIDLSRYETTTGPVRTALNREAQAGQELVKAALPSAARVVVGGLGGANAAMSGYEAWEMAQKLKEAKDPSWVDWARLASKTASTVGGGLSMLPFGITQAAGLALQAPDVAWSSYEALRDAARNATREQTDRMLMNTDPMGNTLGTAP